MVKIVSTHAILGEERTGDMYGWGTANPEMGERNNIKSEVETKRIIQKRVARKKLRDSQGREGAANV